MAVTMKHMSLIVSLFGVLSFLLGVIAENKKVFVYSSSRVNIEFPYCLGGWSCLRFCVHVTE